MPNVTLRQLEYFTAVAEAGSVSKGARDALVSQSAMSAALAELEKSLGTTLFQRHRHGVTLTPGGIRLIARARSLLAQASDLESVASEIDDSLRGPLRIGCYSTLAPSMMAPTVESFLRANPEVELSFFEGSDQELLLALRQGECELAITYDFKLARFNKDQALMRIPLTSAPPKAIIPLGHPLADHKISLRDLVAEPLILLDLAPAAEYFLGIFESRGLTPHVRFRTKSIQLVQNLVAHGLGCSVLTQAKPAEDLGRTEKLLVRDVSDDLPPLPIVALYPDNVRPTQRVEVFVKHCRYALQAR